MLTRTKLSIIAAGAITALALTGCAATPTVSAAPLSKTLSSSPTSATIELAPEAESVISEATSATTPTPVLAPVILPSEEVVTPAPVTAVTEDPALVAAPVEVVLPNVDTPAPAPVEVVAPVATTPVEAPVIIAPPAPVIIEETPAAAVVEVAPETTPEAPAAKPEAVEAPIATAPTKAAPVAEIAPEALEVEVVEAPAVEASIVEEEINVATDEELVVVAPEAETSVGEAISESAPDALVRCEFAGYLFSESVTPEDCIAIFAAYEDAVANAELYRNIGSAWSDSTMTGVPVSTYNLTVINSGKSDTTTINTRGVLDQVVRDINAASDAAAAN